MNCIGIGSHTFNQLLILFSGNHLVKRLYFWENFVVEFCLGSFQILINISLVLGLAYCMKQILGGFLGSCINFTAEHYNLYGLIVKMINNSAETAQNAD